MTRFISILEPRSERLELFGDDTDDLLSSIEDAFDVTLTRDDLVQATTVRKLAECLSRKLEFPVADRCLSAIVFHRLRRSIVDHLDVARTGITPQTRLKELLPWHDRLSHWPRIQFRSQLTLPDLGCPFWLVGLCLVTAFALPIAGLRWLRVSSGELSVMVVLSGFLFFALLLWVIKPLARSFPRSCETLGDLAKLTLARNYGKIAARCGKSSEQELLASLCLLLAAATPSDTGNISPETRFPEGLGIC